MLVSAPALGHRCFAAIHLPRGQTGVRPGSPSKRTGSAVSPANGGYRFSAEQLLELLAAGRTVEEIQADYPFTETDDVGEVLWLRPPRPIGSSTFRCRNPLFKLLVDQNLRHRLPAMLRPEGHDVTHTEDEDMATATDPVILWWCCEAERTLITADKEMTKFLVGSDVHCPSSLVTRELRTLTFERLAAMLLANHLSRRSSPSTATPSSPSRRTSRSEPNFSR